MMLIAVLGLLGIGLVVLWLVRLVVRGVEELIARTPPDPLTTPAEYGLGFIEVWFTSDGLRLHGWFIPTGGVDPHMSEDANWGPARKGTVIFCHGRWGSKDPDLKYVSWFHEAGYHVFMFDFRGHGRSEGEYCSYGYFERWDLEAAVELLQKKGQGPLGVLGFSFGGAMAIYGTAQIPAIRCVVSDGGYAELGKGIIAGSRGRGYPPILARFLYTLVLWLAGRRLGCNLSDADPIRWVGKIAPRALFLIHAGQDKFVGNQDIEQLFVAAGEPKELWVVAEAEHRKVDEMQPEEYRRRLLDFFDRYLASELEEGEREPVGADRHLASMRGFKAPGADV